MKESLHIIMNTFLLTDHTTWILGILFILGLAVWMISAVGKRSFVVRPGEVAVLADRRNGTFTGFRSAGLYLKLPALHTLRGTIATHPQSLAGRCEAITRDGYQLDLHWTVRYHLDPGIIEPTLQPSMAEILLSHPTRIAELQTNYCLKRIIGQHPLERLREEGVMPKVNPHSTRSAMDCLAAYGIMVESIQIETPHWSETGKAAIEGLAVAPASKPNPVQRIGTRPESNQQPALNANPPSHAWM